MSFKTLFRRPDVQGVLAVLLSTYLDFALRSTRWRFENRAPADAVVEAPTGIVACFWHGNIPLGPACRAVLKTKPRKVIISLSADGQFIAKAMERLSFGSIRGSSGRGGEADDKGGSAALREAVKFLRSGGVVAITPDGPRGPINEMAAGPVTLAKISGAPVMLFGLCAKPAIRLKSWDRTLIPLPFGRGVVVFDGPFHVARGADDEAVRLDWQARLCAADRAAEALLR
jgi:lysophospholipid acyltransferase (LPLAT)-like uncharacterized protein